MRDPRKKKAVTSVVQHHAQEQQQPPQQYQSKTQVQTPLPFSPSDQNQQSVGSSLGSYMLAGVGVALGVTLVRVVIGFAVTCSACGVMVRSLSSNVSDHGVDSLANAVRVWQR